jgi:GNAT superfamily N-acetyltransferase
MEAQLARTVLAEPRFEVRPAKKADMQLVREFVRSSAHWYRPIVDEKDMKEHDVSENWAETNFSRRDFYVGMVDRKPVGTISIQYFGDYAYLGYIYLHVKHVGKGYGRRLMKFAETVALKKGMKGMALIAHPRAKWAKRAYLKFGFEIVASDKRDVLSWQDGILKSYYEEAFELFLYEFSREREVTAQLEAQHG